MTRTRNPPSPTAQTTSSRQATRQALGSRKVSLSGPVVAQLDAIATHTHDRTRASCMAHLIHEAFLANK